MDERLDEFRKQAGWGQTSVTPVVGDLSARQYHRLTDRNGRTAILMDDRQDNATERFVAMTHWLRGIGLSAPEILAEDTDAGLLLIEDLGQTHPVSLSDSDEFRKCCNDVLVHIRRATAPQLPAPDASTLTGWTALADDYLPGADRAALSEFRARLETLLAGILTEPPTVSLRDFHLDNLMWLPDRQGLGRLGLLDYQDAFLTHPVYDLVSLLTDARRDVPSELRETMIADYAQRTGDDLKDLKRAFAVFSAQRNLRILGIFARAAEAGKAHHTDKMPRVRAHFFDALEHPDFDTVREAMQKAIP